MLHCVVGITAGLGPIGVDDRLRQADRGFCQLWIGLKLAVEAQDRNAFPGQGLLLGREPTATCEHQADEQDRGYGRSKHAILNRSYGASAAVISAARARKSRGVARSSAKVLYVSSAAFLLPSFSSAVAVSSSAVGRHGLPGAVNGTSLEIVVLGSASGRS